MKVLFRLIWVFGLSFTLNPIPGSGQNTVKTDLQNRQLLVVVSGGWDSLQGRIYCFEKRKAKWILKFSNPVVLGSKGLGMGEGMVTMFIDGAPVKKEGDLKSPAGIFSIGTAFGNATPGEAKWIQNPYICTTDTLICVDDLHSAHYNTLVNKNPEKADWNSFEEMHRKDDYYKWGLFINHNADKPIAGKGSCIFMHIWENDHTGTTGCTAMNEEKFLRILHWINADKKPLLIQLPLKEYRSQVEKFRLPEIPAE
jgi:D-alanyl-D-alanine dipeptidase